MWQLWASQPNAAPNLTNFERKQSDTENRAKENRTDVESLLLGGVERVRLDSLWDRDARLRWCVREAPRLLLLLTVRTRGSTECGGGEERKEEGAAEEERDTSA